MQNLGSISSLMKMFPWSPSMGMAEPDKGQLNRTQTIIQLMMIQERRKTALTSIDS
jgi:signal recognition particle GTPase